jgi:hypothetical protein
VGGGPNGIGGGIAGLPDIGMPPPPPDDGATGATGVCAELPVIGREGAAEAGGATSVGAAGTAIGADASCIGGPMFDTPSAIGGDWIGACPPEPEDGPEAPLLGSTLG